MYKDFADADKCATIKKLLGGKKPHTDYFYVGSANNIMKWIDIFDSFKTIEAATGIMFNDQDYIKAASRPAFNFDMLFKLIPNELRIDERYFILALYKSYDGKMFCEYSGHDKCFKRTYGTPANALADMIILLLNENIYPL